MDLFWPLLAYFLGSLPFGLFIGRIVAGVDLREHGSRNTGATNVARTCGLKWGILALVLDVLKGFAPVAMAADYNAAPAYLTIVALCAVFGHAFSVFLKMKGGKSVATALGVFLALAPTVTLLTAAISVVIIFASGYVSLGSLTIALLLPGLSFLLGDWSFVPLGLVLTCLLFWRHKDNIDRLYRGEEMPFRKKKAAEDDGQ